MKNKSPIRLLSIFVCLIVLTGTVVVMTTAISSGAEGYSASTLAIEKQYTARTLLSYLSAKAQGANTAGAVYVSDFEGIPCLNIEEVYDGDTYVTFVYAYEGHIRELFCMADSGLMPEDGMDVLKCDDFTPTQVSDSLIHLSITCEGNEAFGYISVLAEEVR